MASALDEDEICNDDYYSLLNVRREVKYVVVLWIDMFADVSVSRSVNFLRLIVSGS